MPSFSVVEFVDEIDDDGCKQVDIIPSEWFEGTDGKLYWWPPATLLNVTKAVKEGTPPAENWILCNVRVMGNAGRYCLNLNHHINPSKARSKHFHSHTKQLESSEQSDSEEELPPTPPEKLLGPAAKKMTSRSPAAQRVAVQRVASPSCEAMFIKLLPIVKEIKETQKIHGKMLNALLKKQDASIMEVPDGVVFPLQTQADVEALEEKLGDRSLMSAVVAMVADIGGTSVDDATRRMMKYILSNELALNMFGRHGKKRLKDLRLFSVVYVHNGILLFHQKPPSGDSSFHPEALEESGPGGKTCFHS
ncbi:hypothetical protein PAMP_000769 [Pampus punctatissimus]